MVQLYQVETAYYSAGIIVKDGVIYKAAPILRWTQSLQIEWFKGYCERKKLKIVLISEE